jgi:hypothetical protein
MSLDGSVICCRQKGGVSDEAIDALDDFGAKEEI